MTIIKTGLNKVILASVVREDSAEKIISGGTGPVYVAKDEKEQQTIAMYLSRITEGVIHDLENGILIIVSH